MRAVLCVLLLAAAVRADEPEHPHRHRRHHHRHHKAPLEMEGSPALEELEGQAHLQLEPATPVSALAALNNAGPLTRADYGGEKPYETREIVDDDVTVESATDPAAPKYELEQVPDNKEEVDTTNTVPRLLADGRLVRVPASGAPADTPVSIEVPTPPRVQLSSPELEDVNALQLEAGLEANTKVNAKYNPNDPTDPTYISPTYPVTPKVRVSSLVGGILSSVLSSVLTRGMNFKSADLQE